MMQHDFHMEYYYWFIWNRDNGTDYWPPNT
jgi:hypothetical protein